MYRPGKLLRSTWQALLAVVVLGLLPLASDASGIGFKNDTNQPLYIQGATTSNGQTKRGLLLVIPPGATKWDVNLSAKTLRVITITDASGRILYQDVKYFQGMDMLFSVAPLPPMPKTPPKVDLKGPLPLPPGM